MQRATGPSGPLVNRNQFNAAYMLAERPATCEASRIREDVREDASKDTVVTSDGLKHTARRFEFVFHFSQQLLSFLKNVEF